MASDTPGTGLLRRSNALPAALSPTPLPQRGVTVVAHQLHSVLRPSEQGEDVREKPRWDGGFCSC